MAEGQSLACLLGAKDIPLPWNKAFSGRAAAVGSAQTGFTEMPCQAGWPRITLLSPTPARLDALFKVWEKELARLRSKESDGPLPVKPSSREPPGIDVATLAGKKTPVVDKAAPNGSSIAIMIEHQGASVLLGADAFATVLVPGLLKLAKHRGLAVPLYVDVFKLSHHGSRANLPIDLLAAVKSPQYVFSTNNAIFNHPDDEAVARILVHGGQQHTLWFNYATPRNRRWADTDLMAQYGYQVRYPDGPNTGW